ncbi:MAG: DMT family transporter [Desulfovibrionaceae bacterium]
MVQLLLGAFCISFSPVFVRLAGVPADASAFWRMVFGGLGTVVLLAATGGLRPARSGAGRLTWRVLAPAVLGAVFLALDLMCWHRSILRIGPGLATMLANFQAVILAVVGLVALREGRAGRTLGAVGLALAGLWFMAGAGWDRAGADFRSGVLLGLATAALYSGYLLGMRRASRLAGSGAAHPLVAVVSLATATVVGLAMLGAGADFAIPGGRALGWLVAYGLVGQVAGWWCITRGMASAPASRIGLVLLLQPVLSYLWDVLLFHKPLDGVELFGMALALAGIALGTGLGSGRRRAASDALGRHGNLNS